MWHNGSVRRQLGGRARACGLSIALSLAMVGGPVASASAQASPPAPRSVSTSPTKATGQGDPAPLTLPPTDSEIRQNTPPACRGYSSMGSVANWRSGVVTDPVSKDTFPVGKSDIDWTVDPNRSPSWLIQFHGLAWVRGLLDHFRMTGDAVSFQQALAVLRDHARDNRPGAPTHRSAWTDHAVSLRLTTYACFAAVAPVPADLLPVFEQAAAWQLTPRNYRARHNHGLMQNISLVRLGCEVGRLDWIDGAWSRMASDLRAAVDDQGANNEQSSWYALFNVTQWELGLASVADCGTMFAKTPTAREVIARVGQLHGFVQHLTQPDGLLAVIGDTTADKAGLLDRTDLPLGSLYRAGYATGRSAWGDPKAMHWTLRFGPARDKHGHEDHMSVTYYVDGGRVLTEGGHAGYDQGADRDYIRSPLAHNAPIVPGERFRPGVVTPLLNHTTTPERTLVTVKDDAYGTSRSRSLVAATRERMLATFDRGGGGPVITPWLVDPALTATVVAPGKVLLTGPRTATLSFFDAASCAPLTAAVESGTIGMGWRDYRPTNRVTVRSRGTVTVVSPGDATATCTRSGGSALISVTTGSSSVVFTAQDNGILRG